MGHFDIPKNIQILIEIPHDSSEKQKDKQIERKKMYSPHKSNIFQPLDLFIFKILKQTKYIYEYFKSFKNRIQ